MSAKDAEILQFRMKIFCGTMGSSIVEKRSKKMSFHPTKFIAKCDLRL